jgi:uncharacterized membrane protein
MGIAFAIMYWMTGSAAFGSLAALLEPVLNVSLLPLHEKAWATIRSKMAMAQGRYMALAGEKISQTGMHMAVAFAVMYWATGSLAFGGLVAILEPVCNVIVLPFHDKFWESIRARVERNLHGTQTFAVA